MAVTAGAFAGCYSTGNGSDPTPNQFYFPVGLAVSKDNTALYVVNADFDLKFNGGTVQAYDLQSIRHDVQNNLALRLGLGPPTLPHPPYTQDPPVGNCPDQAVVVSGVLGEACAPPTKASTYVRSEVVIGAFATDLQIAKDGSRLFIPVRGDASLTWLRVDPKAPLTLDCGQKSGRRCSPDFQAGNSLTDPGDSVGNTRQITMPGEPFGIALSEHLEHIAITHQSDTKTSLLSTGWNSTPNVPYLEFVLDGVPTGGNGIAAVPHGFDDTPVELLPRDAFLETSRATPELDLLRVYPDQLGVDAGPVPPVPNPPVVSSLHRPYLLKERAYAVNANSVGTDSRGILVDDSPRRACRVNAGLTGADAYAKCGQIPARLYIANRSPASLILGEVGGNVDTADGPTWDPDRIVMYGSVPLTAGPSKLFLAPILDTNGNYALRLFIVCFDSATVFIWNPESQQLENIIRVAQGPFAMAFDQFDMNAASAKQSPFGAGTLPAPAFLGYLASFTNSFVQVIALDQRQPETFERVVYTLGTPTLPQGSQ